MRYRAFLGRTLRASKIQAALVTASRASRLRVGLNLAALYRRACLQRVVFIGVTGSCGKTTTKELIAGVLSSRFKGHKSYSYANRPNEIARTVFSVRPWHAFCVQEIAAAAGGDKFPLEEPLRLVRPQIGVVTNVGLDHIAAFGSIEAIAAEKGKLIEALPRLGTAVLNADDERVFAMQTRCAGRIITYGLSPDATVRAQNVSCRWPERLSFTVAYNTESLPVQTQLCGEHWVPCVLAAIAVGLVMGVSLTTAVKAIQDVQPFMSRMQPETDPDGVTFIRDHMKAPFWSIPPALQFMRDARAKRKIVVIGHISDFVGHSDNKYTSVARQALAVADLVVFVGSYASKSLKAKRYSKDEALQAFNSVEAASEYLNAFLQSGDLVLLKGSWRDRLRTIILNRQRQLESPWQRGGLAVPRESRRPTATSDDDFTRCAPGQTAAKTDEIEPSRADSQAQAVVGLGNAGTKYRDTPHNVGQRVVDLLADSLGGGWKQLGQAMVASVTYRGRPIHLIKLLTMMNASGPAVLQVSTQLGFGPAQCVLVHDDINLPLGTVRTRVRRSSDGGHRGIRSVLQAFRTDEIRRVKIGVGHGNSEEIQETLDYVLSPFSPPALSMIDKACAEAAHRVLDIAASWQPQTTSQHHT
jgi:aminoacyl-tRNA hydrolase